MIDFYFYTMPITPGWGSSNRKSITILDIQIIEFLAWLINLHFILVNPKVVKCMTLSLRIQ